jgi:hypothetical protein
MLNTNDYRNAPSNIGPQAATWKDKPHRLVYDLCSEIERLTSGEECYPKLLTHYGKHGDDHIVVLDKKMETEAWLAMFRLMDEAEDMYADLTNNYELAWYNSAKSGDAQHAKWLLEVRSQHEYERVEITGINTPQSLTRQLDICLPHED